MAPMLVLQQLQAVRGEVLRIVRYPYVVRRMDLEALRAHRGRNHRQSGRHRFVDFQAGAPADAQRHYGNGCAPHVRPHILHRAGDQHARNGPAQFQNALGRRPAHDGEFALRAPPSDERQDLLNKVSHAVHVRKPVHRPDEHQVGNRGVRGGPREVPDIHARRDLGDVANAEHGLHQFHVRLRDRDDVAGGPARRALVVEHAPGLEAEVQLAQRTPSVLGAPPPDHCLDVVLEQHALPQVGAGWRHRQEIHNHTVERFAVEQFFDLLPQRGRPEPADREWKAREQRARCLGRKLHGPLIRHRMPYRVRPRGIFAGRGRRVRMSRVLERNVVHLVPPR